MTDAVLRFRLARCGLGADPPRSPAEALTAPAQDFVRDSVQLALAARLGGLDRAAFDADVDAGRITVAHVVRGAIHGLPADDLALWGRGLLGADDEEVCRQLGQAAQKHLARAGIAATEALEEVADAVTAALRSEPLDRVALHAALRERVREPLLPWCEGCQSHHVSPMLWRYATIKAGARLDASRRYTLAKPGRAPAAAEPVRRFLRHWGPAPRAAFAEWAGIAPGHARRLWDAAAGDLTATDDGDLLAEDADCLADPPDPAPGVRLVPPGDPALAKPNRERLAPDPAIRKRLFRPVASPGAVLRDGDLAGLWRVKAKGRGVEVTVEPLTRLAKRALQAQADHVAQARGADGASLVLQ